jgi:hypothetical protein
MAILLMIIVLFLVGLGLMAVFAGYQALTRPSSHRMVRSGAYAVGGAILLFAAYATFFYTLRVVLGAE